MLTDLFQTLIIYCPRPILYRLCTIRYYCKISGDYITHYRKLRIGSGIIYNMIINHTDARVIYYDNIGYITERDRREIVPIRIRNNILNATVTFDIFDHGGDMNFTRLMTQYRNNIRSITLSLNHVYNYMSYTKYYKNYRIVYNFRISDSGGYILYSIGYHFDYESSIITFYDTNNSIAFYRYWINGNYYQI